MLWLPYAPGVAGTTLWDMSTRKKSTSRVKVTHNPLGMKLKGTCCRKMPRCTNCPVVYTRLLKTGALENDDIDLPRRLKEARRK